MNTRSSLTRRRLLHTSAAFTAAAPFLVSGAYAAWPDRPVRIIVPFGAGGPVDVISRLLQPLLAEELKGNFFVENKPGAAGSIGVGQAARAEPDGYTVLITSNTIMINPLLYKNVPYDLDKDLAKLRSLMGHRYDEIRDNLPELLERYGDLRDPRAVKSLLARLRIRRGAAAENEANPAELADDEWQLPVAAGRGEPKLN